MTMPVDPISYETPTQVCAVVMNERKEGCAAAHRKSNRQPQQQKSGHMRHRHKCMICVLTKVRAILQHVRAAAVAAVQCQEPALLITAAATNH
jgi:hypothetical protein